MARSEVRPSQLHSCAHSSGMAAVCTFLIALVCSTEPVTHKTALPSNGRQNEGEISAHGGEGSKMAEPTSRMDTSSTLQPRITSAVARKRNGGEQREMGKKDEP